MKLIVGLGNPGNEYISTRHNIGFRVIEELQRQLRYSPWKNQEKWKGELAESSDQTERRFQHLQLCKPRTFMNLSGESVGSLLHYHHLGPQDLLVIADDKDLPFGKLRLRSEGSSGGHRGLESIIGKLGESFTRLKVGVGHLDQQIPTDAFVLQPFSLQEERQLPGIIDQACQKTIEWILQGKAD